MKPSKLDFNMSFKSPWDILEESALNIIFQILTELNRVVRVIICQHSSYEIMTHFEWE